MLTRTDQMLSTQFYQKARVFLWECEKNKSVLPDSLAIPIQRLRENYNKMLPLLINEEGRPKFAVDYRFLEEQNLLGKEIDTERKRFDAEFSDREKQIAQLEHELIEIHRHIMEKQNDQMLTQLTTLVQNNRLNLEIENAIEEQAQIIESQSWCTRNIFCCFASKEAKIAQRKILRLTEEYKKLNSSDPIKVHAAAVSLLNRKREKVQQDLKQAEEKLPKKRDEEKIDRSLEIDAYIARERARHYNTITNESMLQVLGVYNNIENITKALLVVPPNASNQDIIQSSLQSKKELDTLFDSIQCQDRTARELYQQYLVLGSETRVQIEEVDERIVHHPVRAITMEEDKRAMDIKK